MCIRDSFYRGSIRIQLRFRRRERRATIKSAHVQSLQPVQRIFWRDTWKNYRNRIEFPILRRKELISEVSLWQQKMTRRKSDGSFCRYILHNKLCKLLYSELEDSSRKSNANARSERKSDGHPDNNYDDPCDLKNDGHRDHVGDQSTDLEIRNVLCLSNT